MQKSLTIGIQLLAAGMMWLGQATAQQTPAASTTTASGQTTSGQAATSAKKTTGTTAAKKTTGTAGAAAPLTLKTDKDKQSYAEGMNLGMGLHRQGMSLDPALVARGMKDGMSGGKTLLTEDEARAALSKLYDEVGKKIKETQAAFLAENKGKEGVVSLPDGLQYKILTAGTGPKPAATDTVSVNYRGTLVNGTEFDSSAKHGGQPVSFQVGRVIKGWTEALQLMPVGSKWQLFIPSDLAYGDNPPPNSGIIPGSTLIFEVELLAIADPTKK